MQGSPQKNGFGERIREARRNVGLSQAALGKIIGRPQQVIQRWEVEQTRPGIEDFAIVARATQSTPAWLAFAEGEPSPAPSEAA